MVRKILISSEILWNVRVIEFWVLTPAGLSVYLLVVIYLHKVHGLEKKLVKSSRIVLFQNGTTNKCEGRDSNPRTPMRPDPESGAVDLAWLPSHENRKHPTNRIIFVPYYICDSHT